MRNWLRKVSLGCIDPYQNTSGSYGEGLDEESIQRPPPPEYAEQVRTIESIMQNAVELRRLTGARKKWQWEDFDQGQSLGGGSFGMVNRARENTTGFIVAVKRLNLKKFRSMAKYALREIEIHSRLKHPNILQLYNYFKDEQYIVLILEIATIDLHAVIENSPKGHLSSKRAAHYVAQIARGLEHCHSLNVLHRDLKPENVLINIRGIVKLMDFGMSIHSRNLRAETMCGTRFYMAPELYKRESAYTEKVDIWALGVLLFRMVTGKLPWFHRDDTLLEIWIVNTGVPYPPKLGCDIKDLIGKLLQKDPSRRLSLQEVFRHPWILKHIG